MIRNIIAAPCVDVPSLEGIGGIVPSTASRCGSEKLNLCDGGGGGLYRTTHWRIYALCIVYLIEHEPFSIDKPEVAGWLQIMMDVLMNINNYNMGVSKSPVRSGDYGNTITILTTIEQYP
jgi:hypothetical protein